MSGTKAPIVQVVPNYGIGGVEVAALSAAGPGYQVLFLSGPERLAVPDGVQICSSGHAFGLRATRTALREIRSLQPEVVVLSLWKSALLFLGLLVRRERPRLVVLLHAERTFHLPDRVAHAVMLSFADAVWADSQATLDKRYPAAERTRPTRVLSFLAHRVAGVPRTDPAPKLITWGRFNAVKNLGLAIDVFAQIAAERPEATLTLIGEDQGTKPAMVRRVEHLGLGDQVEFLPQMPFAEIVEHAREANFFVQTSTTEGMAMAVAEAMQLGLVPIVTPVGAIPTYCEDTANAVFVESAGQASRDVLAVLQDEARFRRMSQAAVDTWADRPIYAQDIRAAAADLMTPSVRAPGWAG